ncbi:MAG: metallophosphoesterase [Candidatus Parcubacteria bacterium]|nr:metallophosphoesterase [Candidatus Parcubacteria bacterium]
MLQIIIFATIAIGLLAVTHVFLFFSFIKFFTVESVKMQYFIGSILIFLPVGLICAQILSHFYDTYFSRCIFYLFNLWFGTLTALLTFFILAWIATLPPFNAPRFVLGSIVLFASIAYTSYGIWNAYHPEIKHITVTIKNLPEGWKGKKVVQASDIHLGFIWSEAFFHRLIADINVQKPEAVFITGDLFDGTGDKFDYVANDLRKLIAPKGSYFITGNHETYFGVEKSYALLQNSGVTILRDEMKNVDGLQIVGINFENKKVTDTLAKMPEYDRNGPSILLYHEPARTDEAKASGIKLQLSGHTHAGQIFPYGFITSLYYSSLDYGLHKFGDYTLYTSSGAGTWGPAMRVGTNSEIVVITLQ